MEREQSVVYAVGCEVIGLVLMLFVNRVLPDPLNYAATLVGFILLLAGLFIIFASRRKNKKR